LIILQILNNLYIAVAELLNFDINMSIYFYRSVIEFMGKYAIIIS